MTLSSGLSLANNVDSLYLLAFVDTILQSVQGNLTPYVTSAFSQHALLSTTTIVSGIVGGTSKLAIAKIIDIWGRVEGLLFMMILIVVGMIMKATCTNVEMYAAAHTLYWVGHLGLLYVIDVVLADMTSLQNRMIMLSINGTPTIASAFAGPAIAELFYEEVNFRWAFGAFCIILVAFFIPVWVIFFLQHRKAKAMGVAQREPSGRTTWQSIVHYFFEFDFVGMILMIAGWSLILLPFSIASLAPNGWASGYIIAMIVIGVLCLVAFCIWEKWFSPVPYFPWRFLKDRTLLGSALLYGLMFTSIFAWDAYYQSYLQVVHDQSITISGYVLNCFSLGSAFLSPFVGVFIRWTGRYKWPAFAGVPLVTLGTALLIEFRRPSSNIGLLIMCQLLNGFGTGIWTTCGQIAVMASVNHQEIAVALALWGMFGSIGSSLGNAIAGALWTNMAPQRLAQALPEDQKNMTSLIYGSIVEQKAFPLGDPIRMATIDAYAYVQRYMVITGAALVPLMVACLFMWRNIDLKKRQAENPQAKGNIW